jgi:glyoxylase-like metal-dependent hydrolase (beta-lactamase superfamily II)
VLAPNPGPMTLDGTNTYVLPGGIVVDPGPLSEEHLRAVLDQAGEVRLTLVTHWHEDHTESLQRFSELAGCPVRAFDVGFCIDGPTLWDREKIDGWTVLHVPGHTYDSVAFLREEDGVLLSGDTILGRGTAVITHPDGRLGWYLDSLRELKELAENDRIRRILPGHGPEINDPLAVLTYYLQHREERLDQIRAARGAGARTPREVVERVYADVDPSLWPAAELSVRAQLEYLSENGG